MGPTPPSDALVFFGATGDLVFKEILPALQGLVQEGGVRIPLIGVARSPWDSDRLRQRAKESLEKKGLHDPATFQEMAG